MQWDPNIKWRICHCTGVKQWPEDVSETGAASWEDEMNIKGHVQQWETAAGTVIPTLHIAGRAVHRQQLSGKTS